MSLYETLGVEKDATKDEIQAAFRRAAMKAHPDREGGSKEAFQAVEEAGRVLLDDRLRKEYDETGAMPGEESPEAKLRNMSRQIMVSFISKGAGFHDAVKEMKKLLDEELRKNRKLKTSLIDRIEKAKRVGLPKRRKEGSKLLEELQAHAIEYLESEVRRVDTDLEFMGMVMDHFDHWEIDMPEPNRDADFFNALASVMTAGAREKAGF